MKIKGLLTSSTAFSSSRMPINTIRFVLGLPITVGLTDQSISGIVSLLGPLLE